MTTPKPEDKTAEETLTQAGEGEDKKFVTAEEFSQMNTAWENRVKRLEGLVKTAGSPQMVADMELEDAKERVVALEQENATLKLGDRRTKLADQLGIKLTDLDGITSEEGLRVLEVQAQVNGDAKSTPTGSESSSSTDAASGRGTRSAKAELEAKDFIKAYADGEVDDTKRALEIAASWGAHS
ncbi:hypothetical protein CMI37_33160 [Candidatus Pacearchaeota archaeon]|nr:hypothetical protein [Candidatus Pacearchaeota archaeon]|tara:strand:+ start:1635 stop:2183 length:549 start_codon:yes stop_codon:yes gene_type:complete